MGGNTMLATKRLTHQLMAVGRSVHDATDGEINSGGCGVYALAAYDKLISLGWDVSIAKSAQAGWGATKSTACARKELRDSFNGTDLSLTEWHSVGWYLGHCWLVINADRAIAHDATYSVIEAEHGERLFGPRDPSFLERSELDAMVNEPAGWSPFFNRKQIPVVRRLIDAGITLRR